jgi:hypothetical protein
LAIAQLAGGSDREPQRPMLTELRKAGHGALATRRMPARASNQQQPLVE